MTIWRAVGAVLLWFILLNPVQAQVTQLTNFAQLVQSVESGHDVRAIIHFEHCFLNGTLNNDFLRRRLDNATTRFNFTHYLHAEEFIDTRLIDTVTTSIKIFIQNPTGAFITLSGRLSIFADNNATLFLDFMDQQPLLGNWFCTISNGHDGNGLVLFEVL